MGARVVRPVLGGNVNKVYRIKFESITDRVPEPVFVVASCATEATATVQRFLDGRGRLVEAERKADAERQQRARARARRRAR